MPVPEGFVPLKGSESGQARDARMVGSAELAEALSVTINVRRRPDGPPLPDFDYWAATPLDERTYVSREEFAELYGASPEDLETVAAFARRHGLTVIEANAARRTVLVSGTVAQMNEAFGVTLAYFETPSETYRGISGSVHVPRALAPLVESVLGLDNRRIAVHNASVSGLDAFGQLGGAGQAGASPLTPVQVAGLYNFPTTTAKGRTIGIIELGGGYALSDVQAFFNGLGLTSPPLADVGVDGAGNAPAGSVTNVTVGTPTSKSFSISTWPEQSDRVRPSPSTSRPIVRRASLTRSRPRSTTRRTIRRFCRSVGRDPRITGLRPSVRRCVRLCRTPRHSVSRCFSTRATGDPTAWSETAAHM